MSPILDETELSRRALLPAGLRDSLPPDAAHEAAVVEALVACCTARGYERVKPPLVEFEDSLFAGPGAAMTHRSFRLMDPVSQRMMGVRADMTVQIARIASTRLSNAPRPLRLCYAGEVLRVTGTPLTPERERRVAMVSAKAMPVNEVVVSHRGSAPVRSIEDLAGREVSAGSACAARRPASSSICHLGSLMPSPATKESCWRTTTSIAIPM